MTPYTLPQLASRFRKSLVRRDAARLLHRLGSIVTDAGLVFHVGAICAGAWWDDDAVAVAKLESKIDKLADAYGVDVRAVAPDGTVLYHRMTR